MTTPETPTPVDLSPVGFLVVRWDEFATAIKDAEREQKIVGDQIRKLIGVNRSATVNGIEVFTYAPINGLRLKDLEKRLPTIHDQFSRYEYRKVFDAAAFQQAMPDTFAEYQTWRLDRK